MIRIRVAYDEGLDDTEPSPDYDYPDFCDGTERVLRLPVSEYKTELESEAEFDRQRLAGVYRRALGEIHCSRGYWCLKVV